MKSREVTLESAAFLDSEQATALDFKREDMRKIVDGFLACAFDELGVAPRLLDAQGMHTIVGHLLPGRFKRKDPLAAAVLPVLRAYIDFLERNAVVSDVFELRNALETTAPEFEAAVSTGVAAHHAPASREKPFVHKADKVGRNDPCPCGSGRKFKQCCAKLGT
jgi:hypothetical protein